MAKGQMGICSGCKKECTYYHGRKCAECVTAYKKGLYDTDPEKEKARVAKWRSENPGKSDVSIALYLEKNINEITAYRDQYKIDNAESIADTKHDWYIENIEKVVKKSKIWKKNNKGKVNANTSNRRASKLERTPKCQTKLQYKEIQYFYMLVKELQWLSEGQLTVDHIIPLQGENISGLHVPQNLQILNLSDNSKKSNSFDGTYGNEGWKKS